MKRGYPADSLAVQSNDPIKTEHLDIKRQIPSDYVSQRAQYPHVALTSQTTALAPSAGVSTTPAAQLPHNGLSPEEARKYEDLRRRVSSFIPECKNCPVKRVILDQVNGAYICTECGRQTGLYIIESAEWRNFSSDGGSVSNNSRATVDNEDFGTSTMIDGKSTLATRHMRSNISREQRRLNDIRQICHRIKNTLQLSGSVTDHAFELCQQIVKVPIDDAEGKQKAYNREALAAVCMFRACQDLKQDRRMNDFISASGVKSRAFNKQLRYVDDIRRKLLNDHPKDPWVEPNNLARGYCERLGLSLDFIDLVHSIITSAKTNGISSGSKSAPLAAGGVYFAQLIKAETRIKDKNNMLYDIYINSGVSQETVRKIARELYDKRTIVIPEGYTDKNTIDIMPTP